MVVNFGHSQCCLRKVPHAGAASNIISASSDNLVISGYASSTPESPADNSSTDGRSLSNVSSTSSHSLTYEDSNSVAPLTACSDNYRCRPKLESWLAETGLDSDHDTAAIVPVAQRQHPRRTAQSDVTSGRRQRSPPALTRQEDRTEGFVALLVVFTAGLVEAIWPLSACPPKIDTKFYGGGVLPLKTFIQETLRRSKTSYSTLQVALYYLILLKAHLPKSDFTQEQPKGDGCRAMQCGRRMFLAALILASKYLQDRNYSTRAWSKISGLRTVEINQNEVEYLKAIGWNLHVPKEKFDKWSRIVLGLSAQPYRDLFGWKHLITKITPDLSGDFNEYEIGLASPPVSPNPGAYPSGVCSDEKYVSTDDLRTPASSKVWHEPTTGILVEEDATCPPPMPRLHNLPTPQTTPQMTPQTLMSEHCVNPAAITQKSYPRCRASLAAMSSVRNQCLARATLDRCPPPQAQQKCQQVSRTVDRAQVCRRTSPTSSLSSQGSSPASMISDTFTTSTRSRSSSISSNSSLGLTNGLHLYQKINGSCDFTGPEASDESAENQLLRAVSLDSAYLRMDDRSTKTVSPTERNTQSNATSTHHLIPMGGSSENDMVIDLAPSAYEQHLTVSLERPTWISTSFTDLEAAGVLLALPKCGTRSTTTTSSRQTSANATPKGLQSKTNNIDLSKSHKRSHSKTNDALQKEVRKQLQVAVAAENVEIYDTDLHYFTKSASKPPIHKEKQLPFRSWADTKTPVLQGQEYNKRHCATLSEQAADRAAVFLRRSFKSDTAVAYAATFPAPKLAAVSRDQYYGVQYGNVRFEALNRVLPDLVKIILTSPYYYLKTR